MGGTHWSTDAYEEAALLRKKVSEGQLGAESGQGFLHWPTGARERTAQKLQAHVARRLEQQQREHENPPSAPPLSAKDEELARRLRLAVWREALAMVEDGVCDAATVDLMATNTIGLRLAVMGPVENADYVGLDLTLAIHQAVLPSLNASLEVPPGLIRAVRSGTQL